MSSKRKSILKVFTNNEGTPKKQVSIEDEDTSVRRSTRKTKQNTFYFDESFESPEKENKEVKARRSSRKLKQSSRYSKNDFEIKTKPKLGKRNVKKNKDSSEESMELSESEDAEVTESEEGGEESMEEEEESGNDLEMKGSEFLFEEKDVAGKKMYGFQTPKKRSSMVQRAAQIVNSPAFHTPKGKKLVVPTKTPRSVRSRLRKEIAKVVEENDSDFSESESDYEPSVTSSDTDPTDSSDSSDTKSKPKLSQRLTTTIRTTRNKKDLTYKMNTDEYFASHSNKIVTSNHTLQKLKNPKLSEDQLVELLNDVNIAVSSKHGSCMKELCSQSINDFHKWMTVLNEGFSVLVYGLGSKRNLLGQFQKELLAAKFPVIVVNGYFPSLTIKDVLDGILIDILERSDNSNNIYDSLETIEDYFKRNSHQQLYLIVHNIDGEMLRNNKSQNILSQLAAIPNIHLIASIDHINTPLIWDHSKLSKFNFTWWDGTSFLPYTDETSFESSLLVQKSGALVLSSISNVYQSLTKNSKGIFMLIVNYQLSKKSEKHYQGMPFKVLYSQCRENFLVSSDLALRAQLTEFLDHKLVKSKRSGDGTELLMIPINNSILQQFSEEINNN